MLKNPPDEKQLSRMYFELSRIGAPSSGERKKWPYHPKNHEELLAIAAEMSRYDPRLLGILVEYFLHHWNEIFPQRLRWLYQHMSTPQTIAVIAEFAKKASTLSEISTFMEYLQRGLKPVPLQLYFLNIYTPGGKLSERAAEESLSQYKKWGFLAREAPTVDVFHKKTVGHFDADSRRNVLCRLFEEKSSLKISDYLSALRGSITRQQALKDLQKIAILKEEKRGRGAVWEMKMSK